MVAKGKKRSIVADFEDKGALSRRRLAATNARPPLHSFESLICGNKSNSFPLFFFFLPESGITGTLVSFFFFLVLKKRLARVSFINKISRSTLFKSMKLKEEFLRRRRRSFKIIGDNLSNQDPYLTKISRVYSWRKIET